MRVEAERVVEYPVAIRIVPPSEPSLVWFVSLIGSLSESMAHWHDHSSGIWSHSVLEHIREQVSSRLQFSQRSKKRSHSMDSGKIDILT